MIQRKLVQNTLISFIFILVSHGLILGGNTGKISGLVVDAESGEPIPGANVMIEGTMMGQAAGENGNYFILNIPPGAYNVKTQVIGYKILTQTDVRVMGGLTTKLNFSLEQTVIEGEEVIVEVERSFIQADLMASRNIVTSDQIAAIPVDDIEDIVNLTAGFVDGHARGGRDGEIRYYVDGVSTMDPVTGMFDTDVPEYAVEEVSVITSGYSAEFSDAQSGIVEISMKEGGQTFSGNMRYKTSDFGDYKGYKFDDAAGSYKPISGQSDMHRLRNLEFSFGGPLHFLGEATTFHFAGETFKDEGRLPNDYDHKSTFSGKLALRPFPKDKFTLSGNYSNGTQGLYSHLWSQVTNEDMLSDYEPNPLIADPLDSWWNNGQLDTEDKNGNGKLDANEDLNFDGILDTEDSNRDGQLSKMNMLEHLQKYDLTSYNVSGVWSHSLNTNSYLKLQLGIYRTYMKYNVHENINEDINNNGILDLEWDLNGNGIIDINEDLNSNGAWDYEDLNGNGILDGSGVDMYIDENNDGIVDASELTGADSLAFIAAGGNPVRLFMPWEDLPFGSVKDSDGFFVYGSGAGFNRLRWNEDDKFITSGKITYDNQINSEHHIKLGLEGQWWNIFDHDVDLASGGNVYGQNIGTRDGWGEEDQSNILPFSYGVFGEDKMEFKEFVVSAGGRYDYFDPNWAEYPSDLSDPVVNQSTGGEVKNPEKVEAKTYFSPRLGVSFPLSDRDKFWFNYGKMFQKPIFAYLFQNINWDFSGAFPMVGNPNIRPETTVYYEIGVEHRMMENWKIKAVGYYKDIKGLTDTQRYFFTASNYYTIRYNIDYGKIQGLELTLEKRLSHYFGGNINYTYSIAVGKSSSARQNYNLIWANLIVPKEESFLDWDQRHTITSNVYFQADEKAPFNIGFLRNSGANLIFQYGSGLPYSPPARSLETEINTLRGMPTYKLDLSLDKGFAIGNYQLSAFVWIKNLTNRINVIDYTVVDIEWYQLYGDENKDGVVDSKDDYDTVLAAARGKYNDPRFNSEGRTIRVGLAMNF